MKLLLENWRKFINETPLAGMADAPPDKEFDDSEYFVPSPSVGHQQIKTPFFVDDVKKIMSKTKDNWVIITLDNIRNAGRRIASKAFKDWLASKGFPADSKVVVVGSSPYPGDDEAPSWFLHDILGHAAGSDFLRHEGYPGGAGEWIRLNEPVVNWIHLVLKVKNAPASKTDQQFDKIYDIFASIILGDISFKEASSVLELSDKQRKEASEEALEINRKQKELIKKMFDFSDQWVKNIPSDISRPVLLDLWD
jgi:hypothetical protein